MLQKFVPQEFGISYIIQSTLPGIFTLLMLMLVYILVPNKKVSLMHAFWGALAALIGIYIMRKFFGTFIASSVVYTTLYGAMAAIPLLLLWLYLNWAVVIFGAAITAALGEYKDSNTKNFEKSNHNRYYNKKNRNLQKKFLQKEHY